MWTGQGAGACISQCWDLDIKDQIKVLSTLKRFMIGHWYSVPRNFLIYPYIIWTYFPWLYLHFPSFQHHDVCAALDCTSFCRRDFRCLLHRFYLSCDVGFFSYSQKYRFIHSLGSLYGISNLQVVIYYKRYPNDQWVYRYSVSHFSLKSALCWRMGDR